MHRKAKTGEVDVASQQEAATKMSDLEKAKAANATEQGETEAEEDVRLVGVISRDNAEIIED